MNLAVSYLPFTIKKLTGERNSTMMVSSTDMSLALNRRSGADRFEKWSQKQQKTSVHSVLARRGLEKLGSRYITKVCAYLRS